MGYEVVEIDDQVVQQHYHICEPFIQEKIGDRFSHPHIEKVWCNKVGQHDYIYQFHIRTGEFPHHHKFSFLMEVDGHKHKHKHIVEFKEGYHHLYWFSVSNIILLSYIHLSCFGGLGALDYRFSMFNSIIT